MSLKFKLDVDSVVPLIAVEKNRFLGDSAKEVARKIFVHLCQLDGSKTACQFEFTIVGFSPENKGIRYAYKGTRVKLDQPLVVTKGGNQIVFEYSNTVVEC